MTLESTADPAKMIPTISFHGGMDDVVPIDNSTVGTIDFLGSNLIHDALLENNVCSELMVDSNGGHGILTNSAGLDLRLGRASCFFKSIFCSTCSSEFLTEDISANCSAVVNPTTNIQIKVLFEGNYQNGNGTMHDQLAQAGWVPLNHPYSDDPWNFQASVSAASLPANVVDWVLVDALTGTPQITGTPGLSVVESQVGFVLTNGDIVSLEV